MAMIRRLDGAEDWTFGSGIGGFATGMDGLALRIRTRLREWTGDCFFALGRGINWHLADKNEHRIISEIRSSIMANPEVLGISRIEIERAPDRRWVPRVHLMTIYGEVDI